MNKQARRKIGDLLVDAGAITKEALDKSLEIQKAKGGKIGEILISEGYVTQQDIVQALEFQLGIPHINLEKCKIDNATCLFIPENIARRYVLIPVKHENGILSVAMSDPLNVFAIDDLKIYSGMEIQPLVASQSDVIKAIDKYYGSQKAIKAVEEFNREKHASKIAEDDESDNAEDIKNSPAVKLLTTIIEQGIRSRASDIHIEPFETHLKVRYRIDGILSEVMRSDINIMSVISTRVKIIGGMNIAEKRVPQDGRASIEVDRKKWDLRISSLPTTYGEKMVIRIVDKAGLVIPKEKLGFCENDKKMFEGMLKNPYGIVLVTGPTGSGKTTTLYSALNEINKPDVNIITIEDPVESRIDGVNQVQVNPKAGMTFASGLRSILRQDPDVIMVGEIRDTETAQIAVRAAITGHLVLSTLHTNDAPGAISRLIDMEVEPFLVASSVVGVVAQRLVRKVCSNCKQEYIADDNELRLLRIESDKDIVLYKGAGCNMCNGTGYRGRIGVYEMMLITKKHREIINKRGTEEEIRQASLEGGTVPLQESCKKIVFSGETTVKEFVRISHKND